MAPTVREHFELLRYSFVQWALESHIPEDAALDVADKIMGDISPMLVSTESKASNPLRVAARIGTLREEMKYRVDRLLIDVPLNAVIRRDRIGLMFSVIVGVIIAIMIFAMYLPLFKMGQVI
jgi:hypothetical protein